MGDCVFVDFTNANYNEDQSIKKSKSISFKDAVSFLESLNFQFKYVYVVLGGSDGKMSKSKLLQRLCNIYPTIKSNELNDSFFVAVIKRISLRLKNYSCMVRVTNSNESEIQNSNRFIDDITIKSDKLQSSLPAIAATRNKFTDNSIGTAESVIVFDLDDTLIDESNKPLIPNIKSFINNVSKLFTYVVLWSHGTCEHVHRNLKKHDLEKVFNLVISRTYEEQTANKSFAFVFRELNKRYRVTSVTITALVDDLPANYTQDYDYYIQVPTKKKLVQPFYKYAWKKLNDYMYNEEYPRVIRCKQEKEMQNA